MPKATIYNIISNNLCSSNIFNCLNYNDLFSITKIPYLENALNIVYLEDSLEAACPYELRRFWIQEINWAIEFEIERERELDLIDEYEEMVQSYKFDIY